MIYLARPNTGLVSLRIPLIEVVNYAVSIKIHAPSAKILINSKKEGAKVLYGSVADTKGTQGATSVAPFPLHRGRHEPGRVGQRGQ